MAKSVFPPFMEWAVALTIFLYLGAMVLVPGAYGVVPAVLLLLSLAGFRPRAVGRVFEKDDWKFVLALVSFPLMATLLIVWHGDSLSTFDRPSRFIAAAIILTLLIRVRLSPLVVFCGAAAGGVATGGYSVYQTIVGGVGRVTSFDNAIYFGNGSVVLSLVAFCWFV
ncbi:MAG: hypothetical protein ACOCVV_12805, partial [Marinobacter sp.]